MEVTELINKSNIFDPQKFQLEKLRGHFNLKMNKRLPFIRKVQKFANEPIAFHLHKKNDFLQRIDKLDSS